MRLHIHLYFLLLCCLSFGGCREEPLEQTDVETNLTIPGNQQFGLNSLPEDFPDEVPIYPESTVQLGQRTDTGFNVSLLTPHDFDRVAAYHRNAISRPGWTVVTDDEFDVGGKKAMLLIVESDSLKCSFQISPGIDAKGEVRIHGITIYVEKKN